MFEVQKLYLNLRAEYPYRQFTGSMVALQERLSKELRPEQVQTLHRGWWFNSTHTNCPGRTL